MLERGREKDMESKNRWEKERERDIQREREGGYRERERA